MKKIAIIALCLGFTAVKAQEVKEAEVPAKVKEGFAKKYPGRPVFSVPGE